MVFHLVIASVFCGSEYPAVMISVPHTQYQPKKLLALNSLISYFLKLISYICQTFQLLYFSQILLISLLSVAFYNFLFSRDIPLYEVRAMKKLFCIFSI